MGKSDDNYESDEEELNELAELLEESVKNASPVDERITTIHIACSEKKVEEFSRLLMEHGDVPSLFASGSLLTNAINSNWDSLEKVKVILHYNADPNLTDYAGWMPLAVASSNNNPEIIKLLLKHGAQIDSQKNPRRNSALINAVWMGAGAAAAELISHGANILLRDAEGRNAVDIARMRKNKEILEILLGVLKKIAG